MAVLLTGVVAIGVIWLGDLDFVAPIITMFFLNTYGMVNLVAAIERMVGNPSFRPRFNVPLTVSLLGGLGCYGAMFLINTPATIAAIIISYGIFFLLSRRRMVRTWGDVRSGIWTSLARYALLNLERLPPKHGRNWRPNIMVFTGQPYNRQYLVAMAEWLSQGRGIVTFFQLITGNNDQMNAPKLRDTAKKHIRGFIQDRRMAAFAEAQIVSDFSSGAVLVAQSHGVGMLESNTLLMGWSGRPEGRTMLMGVLRRVAALDKSMLFLNVDPDRGFGARQVINVWWGGRGGNADLMLLLAHLIRRHSDWGGAEVRLSRIIDGEEGREDTRKHLGALLEQVRVEATPRIIVRDGASLSDLFAEHSRDVDLTLIGMPVPEAGQEADTGERMETLASAVGTVLLVHNAQTSEDLLQA